MNDDFERVAALSELPDGEIMAVDAQGESILLANVDGHVYAISETCTHEGAPLSEGFLTGEACIECPWHAGQFEITTGSVISPPPLVDLATYEVRVDGDDIYVGRPI
ncbi:MAG: non-heme iron oxygenase ferredoxin subunit [Chloroflexi bacterium]|nr:non-heme iron oxygenase ferredoxin subunit [Chloroflexota bacterium]